MPSATIIDGDPATGDPVQSPVTPTQATRYAAIPMVTAEGDLANTFMFIAQVDSEVTLLMFDATANSFFTGSESTEPETLPWSSGLDSFLTANAFSGSLGDLRLIDSQGVVSAAPTVQAGVGPEMTALLQRLIDEATATPNSNVMTMANTSAPSTTPDQSPSWYDILTGEEIIFPPSPYIPPPPVITINDELSYELFPGPPEPFEPGDAPRFDLIYVEYQPTPDIGFWVRPYVEFDNYTSPPVFWVSLGVWFSF